jgi:hypothetical protein
MKKSFLALVVTALIATSAVGCSDQTEEKKEPKQTQPQSADQSNANSSKVPSNQGQQTNETMKESDEPSHQEIKEAFHLDGYRPLSMLAMTNIAMGKTDLPLDEKQRLNLAKAINQGMAAANWKQGDLPPAIFINGDGSSFGIGLKRPNGELQLEMFEAQPDGTYKSVKKETKQGKTS